MINNCPVRLRGVLNVIKNKFARKILIPVATLVSVPFLSSFSYVNSYADSINSPSVISDGDNYVEKVADMFDPALDAPASDPNVDAGVISEGEQAPAQNNSSDLYLTDDVLNHSLQIYGLANSVNVYDPDADYEGYDFDKDDWRLILINKSHSIPDDYEVPLGTVYGSWQCDKRAIPDLLLMLKDARAAGTGVYIASPYRTSSMQVMLYNNKITKFMNTGMSYLEAYKLAGQAVTIPGTSEHEVGLCFDFLSNDYKALNEGFEDTKAGKWLKENAHKYGFILRYPKDKEYITTIEYEPWHFRYVGVEAASVMYNEGITLEEFWEIYID